MASNVAPSGLNYQPALHSSMPATATTRLFYPSNAQEFSPTSTKMIRMELSCDSFIDFANSYVMFDIHNTDGTNAAGLGLGVPMFDRIRVLSSSGVVLEDIESYNELHAMLTRLTTGQNFHNTQTIFTAQNTTANSGNATDQIAASGSRRISFHPITAITNCDKYFPALLVQGLVFEFYLADGAKVMASNDNVAGQYKITNFRYVAQLIDVDRGFVDRIRQYQQASGGVLTLNSETFLHFLGTLSQNGTSQDIPHAIRAKSIKSLFTAFMSRTATNKKHYVGHHIDPKVIEYNWRIGSRMYPPAKVEHNKDGTKLSQLAMELYKAVGVQAHNNPLHGSQVLRTNFIKGETSTVGSNDQYGTFAIGLDCDVWSGKGGSIENGINTSDRALACNLELKLSAAPSADLDVHTWAQCDCIFYIDTSGQISPSI